MRIGIDATPLPPNPVGAGNYIIQLVRALLTLGSEHQFVIFVQHSGYHYLKKADDTPAQVDSAPKSRPVPAPEWVITSDKPPALRLLWEQTVLPALASRYRLDLLHSLHYTRPVFLPCASVVTFHDMTFFLFPQLHTLPKRLFFPVMMHLSARHAAALLANSENTRRDAMRVLKIPSQRISVTPLGIDAAFRPIDDQALLEECRQRYRLPQRFILYVGTLEPRKNLPLLLNAYARLSQHGEDIPLVITGRPGWMYEDIFSQIKTLGIQERVQFTGYIPAQDLPIVYNLAQVFVYPSLYEGFGFPPLEAMACGTPTITTAVSAMLELVGDGALLVPAHDEAALSETMLKVLDDPKLQQELSARGCRQAAKFTWNQTAQATLRVYQQVAALR